MGPLGQWARISARKSWTWWKLTQSFGACKLRIHENHAGKSAGASLKGSRRKKEPAFERVFPRVTECGSEGHSDPAGCRLLFPCAAGWMCYGAWCVRLTTTAPLPAKLFDWGLVLGYQDGLLSSEVCAIFK